VNGDVAPYLRQTEHMEAIPGSADALHSQRKAETRRPACTVRTAVAGNPDGDIPDSQTQWETLLDQVWRCEAEWRFDDRLDLATRSRR
jgi:hypothetical protein